MASDLDTAGFLSEPCKHEMFRRFLVPQASDW
jgi:hypothetical protein